MNGRTRKLQQGLAYSDVVRKGTNWEATRAQHGPHHPRSQQAWGGFHRTYKDFAKIAGPGEHPSRFFMNRDKRIQQTGPMRKPGGFGATSQRRDRYPIYTPGILYK